MSVLRKLGGGTEKAPRIRELYAQLAGCEACHRPGRGAGRRRVMHRACLRRCWLGASAGVVAARHLRASSIVLTANRRRKAEKCLGGRSTISSDSRARNTTKSGALAACL